MYRLTEKRLAAITPILERFRERLFSSHRFDAVVFEMELRERLDTGHIGMRSVAEALLRNERYCEVGVWYMEHSNPGTGVARGFQIPLASVYGTKYFGSPNREALREQYWANVFKGDKAQ